MLMQACTIHRPNEDADNDGAAAEATIDEVIDPAITPV